MSLRNAVCEICITTGHISEKFFWSGENCKIFLVYFNHLSDWCQANFEKIFCTLAMEGPVMDQILQTQEQSTKQERTKTRGPQAMARSPE